MHRFYLPPTECHNDPLMLTGREAHHALRVLRVRHGDRVTVLDGAGNEFLCEVRNHDRDKLQLAIIQKKTVPPPSCPVTLLQAVPKGKLIESVIQKATELGVWRIVPLLSERVAMQPDREHPERKAQKWQQVAVEAIKQCGSTWLPHVDEPVTPAQFVAKKEKFELALISSLQPGSRHLREIFGEFKTRHGHLPKSLCVWVGPEGDFTAGEVALAQAAGVQPITLGPLVLRVETAAVCSLAIINYELQAP